MTATTRDRWRVSDYLFGPETGARLAIVQGGLIVLMAARIVFSPFRGLTPEPAGLWRPVPFLSFLHQMPALWVIVTLQIVGFVAAVTWFAGAKLPHRRAWRQGAFALTWVCLIVLVGLRASRGKILHNDLLLIWGAVPLLFAPGDATLADRTPTRRFGWTIRTSIVLVSLMYFLTGFWKLRNTGIEWVFSDNLRWALYGSEKAAWRGLGLFIANHPWMAVASAAWILLFELTFPINIFVRQVRPLYVVGAWMLHFGTFLIMGLDYWTYAIVVTILLIDWPRVVDRVRAKRVMTYA
jgi:hypothetical protein